MWEAWYWANTVFSLDFAFYDSVSRSEICRQLGWIPIVYCLSVARNTHATCTETRRLGIFFESDQSFPSDRQSRIHRTFLLNDLSWWSQSWSRSLIQRLYSPKDMHMVGGVISHALVNRAATLMVEFGFDLGLLSKLRNLPSSDFDGRWLSTVPLELSKPLNRSVQRFVPDP